MVIGRRDVEAMEVAWFGVLLVEEGRVDHGLKGVGPVVREVVQEGAEKERSR